MSGDGVYVVFDDAALAQLFGSPDGPVGKTLTRIALKVERAAKHNASTPGGGRTYRRRGRVHTASPPGTGPAVDTARLRSSITHEVGKVGTTLIARVGSNVDYAPYLELGTSKMRPRPFLRPALTAVGAGTAWSNQYGSGRAGGFEVV